MPATRDASGKISVDLFEAPPHTKTVAETLAKASRISLIQRQCNRSPRIREMFRRFFESASIHDQQISRELGLEHINFGPRPKAKLLAESSARLFERATRGKLPKVKSRDRYAPPIVRTAGMSSDDLFAAFGPRPSVVV